MVIFHCYVSLPEGIYIYITIYTPVASVIPGGYQRTFRAAPSLSKLVRPGYKSMVHKTSRITHNN